MAAEEARGLTESRSPLDLIESECRRRGWRVRRVPHGLEITEAADTAPRLFRWPPAPAIRKSAIPALILEARSLRAVPTKACEPQRSIELPVCVKPDVGSLARGFRVIHTDAQWNAFAQDETRLADFVVQPLLTGIERRVTLCGNGTFAMADLEERRGALSRWNDSTEAAPREWLVDLQAVVRRLGVPVAGVDVIESQRFAYLLDINVAPDLAVHLATDPPRDLAASVLDSWVDAVRTPPSDPSPPRPVP